MGANAGRLVQTARAAFRALSQVRGSPADSVRPGQTVRSWLGVKGSRVQIPPSRLFRVVFRPRFREPTGEPTELLVSRRLRLRGLRDLGLENPVLAVASLVSAGLISCR